MELMEPPKKAAETPPEPPPDNYGRGKHPNSGAGRNKGPGPNQYRDQKGHIRTRGPEPAPEPTVPDPEDPLAAMKRVLAGMATATPLDQAFVDLLARDPVKFLAEKKRLENPVDVPARYPGTRAGRKGARCAGVTRALPTRTTRSHLR
jgi:hypothetical protein